MKGQLFSSDLIAALMIFLVLIGSIAFVYSQVLDSHSRDLDRKFLEIEGMKVFENLIRTRGLPENWEGLPAAEYSVDNNTIGLYHMNEGSGGTTIDSSGINPIDGDLEPSPPGGPAWKTGSNCKINSCLELDGSNDWVKVKHVSPAYEIKDYTLEMWVYPISGSTPNNPDQKLVYKSGQFYIKLVGGNQISFLVNGVGEFSAPALSLNKWSHIALTVDHLPSQFKTEAKFYVNGVQTTISGPCGTGTTLQCFGTPTTSTSDIALGSQDGSQNFFNGRIDEFRFSNTVRTNFNIAGADPIVLGLSTSNNNILDSDKVNVFFNMKYSNIKSVFGLGSDFELKFVNSGKTKGAAPNSTIENVVFFRRFGLYNNSVENIEFKIWRPV